MKKVTIRDVSSFNHKNIQINGWVYNSRRSGKIGFLMLRDGFGLLQCIVEKKQIGEEQFDEFKKLTQETSISVKGNVVENDRAIGGYELLVDSFKVHQMSVDYPITPKEHGTDFLMNNRHLWLRSKRQHAILNVKQAFMASFKKAACNIKSSPSNYKKYSRFL